MDVLYHYCPTASFHAIVHSRALWLSSLSLGNDTLEGKLVAETIVRLAERDGFKRTAILRLQEHIGFLEQLIDGLGFCLSERGDLLSQWRGYAADATGVAIGFRTEYLRRLSRSHQTGPEGQLFIYKVDYEASGHEALVAPAFHELKKIINGEAVNKSGAGNPHHVSTDEQIREVMLSFFPHFFRLKSSAFREENEWRLLSFLTRGGNDHCFHRALDDRIVPYREFKIVPGRGPIAEVLLGPKHGTPPQVVVDYLKQLGYGQVRVRRSDASYR